MFELERTVQSRLSRCHEAIQQLSADRSLSPAQRSAVLGRILIYELQCRLESGSAIVLDHYPWERLAPQHVAAVTIATAHALYSGRLPCGSERLQPVAHLPVRASPSPFVCARNTGTCAGAWGVRGVAHRPDGGWY